MMRAKTKSVIEAACLCVSTALTVGCGQEEGGGTAVDGGASGSSGSAAAGGAGGAGGSTGSSGSRASGGEVGASDGGASTGTGGRASTPSDGGPDATGGGPDATGPGSGGTGDGGWVVEGDAVQVILLAGQSNMQGSNTSQQAFDAILCAAGVDVAGGCSELDIDGSGLDPVLLAQVEADLSAESPPAIPAGVEERLSRFLCLAGSDAVGGCDGEMFDMTDRFFRSISGFYCTDSCNYGYNAHRHMSSAISLDGMVADGILTAALQEARDDVSVIVYTGSLSDEGVREYSTKSGPLAPGFGANSGNVFGPELAFGHYVGEVLDQDVLLIKVVQGGTSLRVDWRSPSVEENDGNAYLPEELDVESMYSKLIEAGRSVENPDELIALFPQYAGRDFELAGVVWFQGWNDGNAPAADQYEENFRRFIADMRKDLGRPTLPTVVAVSHRDDPSGPIQTGQVTVANETDAMASTPTDDLSGYFHFDAGAYLVIGERMAKTMIELQSE